jgi:hypothetical protein
VPRDAPRIRPIHSIVGPLDPAFLPPVRQREDDLQWAERLDRIVQLAASARFASPVRSSAGTIPATVVPAVFSEDPSRVAGGA